MKNRVILKAFTIVLMLISILTIALSIILQHYTPYLVESMIYV